MKAWFLAAGALVVGFVLGYITRPAIAPAIPGSSSIVATSSSQPTDAEATAAFRRMKTDPLFRTPEAMVTLSECGPSKIQSGIECAATIVDKPGDRPRNKMLGFARFNGQWERTY